MMTVICLCTVAPVILTTPMNVTAVESIPGPYTFQCLATGRPRPTITWLFMGAMVENTNTTTITDMETGDRQIMSTLSFSTVVPSDDGMYTCSAENDVMNNGVVTANVTLTVNGEWLSSTFENINTDCLFSLWYIYVFPYIM